LYYFFLLKYSVPARRKSPEKFGVSNRCVISVSSENGDIDKFIGITDTSILKNERSDVFLYTSATIRILEIFLKIDKIHTPYADNIQE